MILPIRVFGDPSLRQATQMIEENSDDLQQLLDDMIETMHGASGIGLAAPQIGRDERVFVVDLAPLAAELKEEGQNVPEGPLVFINPQLTGQSSDTCEYEEGCLSIPDVRELVTRPVSVRVEYRDREMQLRHMEAEGMLARVIQHEYDHLEGVLFTDHISAFRRRLLKRRLQAIKEGEADADYLLESPVA